VLLLHVSSKAYLLYVKTSNGDTALHLVANLKFREENNPSSLNFIKLLYMQGADFDVENNVSIKYGIHEFLFD
jgi:uncharacterized protein YlbG (UPF0298 family)